MSSNWREIAAAEASQGATCRFLGSAGSARGCLRRQAGLVTAAATLLFLLAAGAGQQAQAQTSTPTFTSVYSFAGGTDGYEPLGSVVEDQAGNIYGTTEYGGADSDGTIFKISSSVKSVCYNFTGQNQGDGAYPVGGLLLSGGSLYGTASNGGSGKGNVFEVPTSCGSDKVLYEFGSNSPDGANPTAGLTVAPSGNLYGTTFHGGNGYGDGTVFAIAPSSDAETYFYEFKGSSGDGAHPHAGLVSDKNGNLYGTTQNGGLDGLGTVFEIDATGNETVLYSFTGSPDGASPYGRLVMDSQGNLYGTTLQGGTSTNCNGGCGAVFKISFSNGTPTESLLYSFTGGTTDGEYPVGGLVMDSAGNLYGTTWYGGSGSQGTVFEISSSGTETVLHSFSGTDGAYPLATLMLDSSNVLWGTTQSGGTDYYGTVFKIALPMSSVPLSFTSAKLDATAGPPAGFDLQAYFTAGTGGDPIDVDTYGLTLTVGNYTVTIPSSVFKQVPKGWWVTETTVNGVSIQARVSQPSTTSYELQFEETGADITSGPNPATITLSIGNNTGTTTASF